MLIEEWVDADLDCRTGPDAGRLRGERKEICDYVRNSETYLLLGYEDIRARHIKKLIDQYQKELPSSIDGYVEGEVLTMKDLRVRMMKAGYTVNEAISFENAQVILVTSQESIKALSHPLHRLSYYYIIAEKRLITITRKEE